MFDANMKVRYQNSCLYMIRKPSGLNQSSNHKQVSNRTVTCHMWHDTTGSHQKCTADSAPVQWIQFRIIENINEKKSSTEITKSKFSKFFNYTLRCNNELDWSWAPRIVRKYLFDLFYHVSARRRISLVSFFPIFFFFVGVRSALEQKMEKVSRVHVCLGVSCSCGISLGLLLPLHPIGDAIAHRCASIASTTKLPARTGWSFAQSGESMRNYYTCLQCYVI